MDSRLTQTSKQVLLLFLFVMLVQPNFGTKIELDDLDFWFQHEAWFTNHTIPWYKQIPRKYDIVACLYTSHEEYMIHEYIIRNLLAGIQHFFVYETSTDEQEMHLQNAALKEFIENGFVTLRKWDGLQRWGFACLTDAIMVKAKWFALIDTDEYITMVNTSLSLSTYLQRFESDDEIGGVVVFWRWYFSNCHFQAPDPTQSITRSYPFSCPESLERARWKTIAKVDKVLHPIMHTMGYKGNAYHVTQDGKRLHSMNVNTFWTSHRDNEYQLKDLPAEENLFIAHHWGRSFADTTLKLQGPLNHLREYYYDYAYREILCCNRTEYDVQAARLVNIVEHMLRQVPTYPFPRHPVETHERLPESINYFITKLQNNMDFDRYKYMEKVPQAKQLVKNGTLFCAFHHFFLFWEDVMSQLPKVEDDAFWIPLDGSKAQPLTTPDKRYIHSDFSPEQTQCAHNGIYHPIMYSLIQAKHNGQIAHMCTHMPDSTHQIRSSPVPWRPDPELQSKRVDHHNKNTDKLISEYMERKKRYEHIPRQRDVILQPI